MAVDLEVLQAYNAARQCVDKGAICHAPESSMYFGRDGLVSACCYSRSSACGRYPDQTIEEIWTGAQAQSMRAAMRRNELPRGCELCADQFHARNFTGFLAHQFDQNARPPANPGLLSRAGALLQPRKFRLYPVRLEFELSNKCNLECSMCSGFFSSSIRANREKLPPLQQTYDKALVRQLIPFLPHLTQAKFLGGEPFLVDLYYEIWDHLIELNPKCTVSITTNGTVYTEKVKRVLDKLNCEIVVSLDSVTKATYESIRKNATLERTIGNLESFSAINRLKNKPLTLAICPMTSNWREIPELVSFANERGMRVFFNTVVFPAAYSLKASPRSMQREIAELYRSSLPGPRTEIESANRDVLEGFCRQIEYWMGEGAAAARPPEDQKCAELLVSHGGSAAVRAVLSDLAGNEMETIEPPLVHIQAADPVELLKAHHRAIWEVGRMLQSSGFLADLCFDPRELEEFLPCFDGMSPQEARQIHLEMRRFPKETLRFCGTLPARKLIELLESYHASQVQPAEALR